MPSLSATRVRVLVAVCALATGAVAATAVILLPWASRGFPPPAASRYVPPEGVVTANPHVQLVQAPLMAVPDELPAVDDRITPTVRVIGVLVNGKPRAYALDAFAEVSCHVVNDVLAGHPLVVTHCPRTECTRVFTAPAGQRLRLGVGGWLNKPGGEQMILREGQEFFTHSTGESLSGRQPLKYQSLEFELTTWGNWRAKHPDSDYYDGGAELTY
jgi:hypothetical protein